MKRDRQAEEKIIGVLLDHAGERLYMSQIAGNAGTAVATTHQILERKAEENFLQKEKLGNLSLYSVNPQAPLVKQLKIKRTVERLQPLVERLKEQGQKIILFGSAAQGSDTIESDFDFFILTDQKGEVLKIIQNSKLSRKIKPVVKNFLEWVEMKEKDKFFYEEIEKGIVLWEEEDERI